MTLNCKCSNGTNSLRMEADFSADPLWCDVCKYNFDLYDLPLSASLKNDLLKWATSYGKWLDLDSNSIKPGMENCQEEHASFGLELFEKTKKELMPKYDIKFVTSKHSSNL